MRVRMKRYVIGLLSMIAALVLAACSGSADTGASTTTATPSPTPAATFAPAQAAGGSFGGGGPQLDQAQITALATCLRARGIEVPADPADLQSLFGGGPPTADLRTSLTECASEVGVTLGGFGGGGGGGGFGGGGAQIDATQVAALAECLQERGFNVPGDATNVQALFGDGPPSADLQAGLDECATEVGVTLGGFGGGGRGGFGGRGQ